MSDASENFELPINERVVYEIVESEESDEIGLSVDGRFVSLSSLAGSLESLVGFQLAIEVVDTSA